LCEPPCNPKETREKIVQMFFETFQASSLTLRNQGTLILDTANITTGIVLDCGHDVTRTIPIYEGHVLHDRINSLDLAGRHITEYLDSLMLQRGYDQISATERQNVARSVKEELCTISTKADEKRNDEKESIPSITDYYTPGHKLYRIYEE